MLRRVDEVRRLASVAVNRFAGRAGGIVRLRDSAKIGGARKAADPIREVLRREIWGEVAGRGLQLGLALTDRFELRDLFLESHSSEQVLDAAFDRLPRVLVDRSGGLCGLRGGASKGWSC